MGKKVGAGLLIGGFASLLMGLPAPVSAATFSVDSTADSPDANPGDGICADAQGRCTLRAAIMEANATGGTNTVDRSPISDPATPIAAEGRTRRVGADANGDEHLQAENRHACED